MTAEISNLLIQPNPNMDAKQALHATLSFENEFGLQDVLIVAYDADGDLFIRSSRMTNAEALFLATQACRWAENGGPK
jgi:hypothetical protein